ncbi:Major facilitator superfamily (MFS) profile domain-containing protein [Plasmodiophora brassicae]
MTTASNVIPHDDDNLHARQRSETTLSSVCTYATFTGYVSILVVANIDAGGVPASLEGIKRSVDLSYMEEGLLGAVVYIGVAGSSIVAGPVFHFLNVKWTLVLMTIVNGAASTLFALGKSTIVLLMSRAVVGITQAFPIIYAPVFVDTFAPKARATLWMSMVLLASPVGIMLGYAAGVFATSLERSSPLDCVLDPWRVPLLLQGIVLLVFGAFGLLVPERHLVAGRTMSPGPLMVPSSANAFRSLVSNGVFVWTTVNLSILYFVVTGIQFWITVYLTEVVHADPVQTGLAFVAISATGPTGGVVFGGWMTDLMGGYSGPRQTLTSLKVSAVLSVLAIAACIGVMFANSLTVVMVLVFILLFAGGATVPSCTGILVSSVPLSLRSYASSISQLSFNIFGYALSPLLSGFVMQITKQRSSGFYSVLLWSLLSIPATAFGLRAASRRLPQCPSSKSSNPSTDQDKCGETSI